MHDTHEYPRMDLEGEISLTPEAAAEVRRLISQTENSQDMMLRVGVQSGGCSGLSYMMSFVRHAGQFDKVFDFGDVKVVVDAKSLAYMDGTVIDFNKELLSGGFKFENPQAARGCGCGTSFSV